MPKYLVSGQRGKGKTIEAKNLKDATRKGRQVYGKNLFMVKRVASRFKGKVREYESYYVV